MFYLCGRSPEADEDTTFPMLHLVTYPDDTLRAFQRETAEYALGNFSSFRFMYLGVRVSKTADFNPLTTAHFVRSSKLTVARVALALAKETMVPKDLAALMWRGDRWVIGHEHEAPLVVWWRKLHEV